MAHTVDVDGMLRRMSPKLFDEWLVINEIQPWGDDWLQTSVLAASIINEIRRILIKDPKDEDFLPFDFLLSQKESGDSPTGDFTASLQAMRARIGV